MEGKGPFLWLSPDGPPDGFRTLPPGGMCLSTFLFLRSRRKILLGRYADTAEWEKLAGLDPERRRVHGRGWTIPARQLKYGEDPRETARDIAENILRCPARQFSEPRVEVDLYEPNRFPGKLHYDVWFLVEATPPPDWRAEVPPWYEQLEWKDPRRLEASQYSRGHEDVVARWLQPRPSRWDPPAG